MMKINAKIPLCLSLLFMTLLFSSCRDKEAKSETNICIIGKYVNNTFLEKIPYTIPDSIPFYCTEMRFFKKDSVYISNGFEGSNFAYKKEGSNYVVLGASFKGNMRFILNQDSSITLIDTAWTNISSSSEFKKATINSNQIFEYYLNEQMVMGEYYLYKEAQRAEQKVIFKANGQLTGLENFTSYSICYSGDCVAQTIPSCNTISLTNENTEKTFAFKVDKKNNMLTIYNVAEGVKDVKGQLAIKDIIFDLRQ